MNKSILGIFSLALLYTACNQESNTDTLISNAHDGVEIVFTPGVSVDLSVPMVYSRGPLDTLYFPKDAQIGIYGAKTTTDAMNDFSWDTMTELHENLSNTLYKATASVPQQLKTDIVVKFPGSANSALAFNAYYPYTANVSYSKENGAPAIPVKIEQNIEDTPDYMYAIASAAIEDNVKMVNVPLTFQHALAQVYFNVYAEGKNFPTPPVLNTITVITNENQTGLMNIFDGTIISSNTDNNKIFAATPNTPITTTESLASQFMFIPSKDVFNKIVLNFTDENNQAIEYTLYDQSVQGTKAISLNAGKITNITIKYTRTAEPISKIQEWSTDHTTNEFEVKND